MASWNLYQTRFRITFTPRLYDLLDEEIRILHRADLVGTHVSSNDIQFQIELPPIINGVNPVANWRHGIVDLVRNSLT